MNKLRTITPKKKGMFQDKRGLGIGDLYPIILTIAVIAILLAVVLFVLDEFTKQIDNGTAAENATKDIITDFVDFIPWIGIILLVVAAAIVLGVVISSFAGGRRGGRV